MTNKKEISFNELYELILERKQLLPAGSYVADLFKKGSDRILKKLAEEAGEVIIASKNDDQDELVWEMADLWFHSLLVLGWHEIPPGRILEELEKRHIAKSKTDESC